MGCGSCGRKYSRQLQEEKKAKVAAHLAGDSTPSVPSRRYRISSPRLTAKQQQKVIAEVAEKKIAEDA